MPRVTAPSYGPGVVLLVRSPIDEARFPLARRQAAEVATVAVDDREAVGIARLDAEDDLFAIGEKEPANAFSVPPVNPVRFFFPDPSGRIVTRLADSLGRTKSAFVVRTISFPSGDQSCLIATSQE